MGNTRKPRTALPKLVCSESDVALYIIVNIRCVAVDRSDNRSLVSYFIVVLIPTRLLHSQVVYIDTQMT